MDHLDKYDELMKILLDKVEFSNGKSYSLRDDFENFYVKGNKTAGTRIRKFMQLVRKAAQDIRDDVQDFKKEI